jgi:DnaJ-class molecular chaperone
MPRETCSACHGQGAYYVALPDRNDPRGGVTDTHRVVCEVCDGKGHTDDSDRCRYLHSMGMGPCPRR